MPHGLMSSTGITATFGSTNESSFTLRRLRFGDLRGSGLRAPAGEAMFWAGYPGYGNYDG
jgi:hypothetical protein